MEEQELIREAMRVIGRKTSDRKALSSRANGEKARSVVTSEEHKAKLREAQKARREREAAAKAALGIVEKPAGKPGRPRTRPATDATAPKRGRGRPRKVETDAGV